MIDFIIEFYDAEDGSCSDRAVCVIATRDRSSKWFSTDEPTYDVMYGLKRIGVDRGSVYTVQKYRNTNEFMRLIAESERVKFNPEGLADIGPVAEMFGVGLSE